MWLWHWLAPLIALLVVLLLFIVSYIIICSVFLRRFDYTYGLKYFDYKHYPNLTVKTVDFPSNRRHLLKGFVYNKPRDKYLGLIVFIHGIGGGHKAYTSFINSLCDKGYIVFAYDQTACGESGGKRFRSMLQGLKDVQSAFNYLSSLEEYKQYKISVIGHSWGGYVANNIARLDLPLEVHKIISIAGFNSEPAQIAHLVPIPFRYIFHICFYYIDMLRFRSLVGYRSLSSLKKTTIKTLLMHGEKDKVVSFNTFLMYKKNAGANPNLEFKSYKNKTHQPYISNHGELICNTQIRKIQTISFLNHNKPSAKAKLLSMKVDFNAASEIDEETMKDIYSFLK